MNGSATERLYSLLPAFHRIRDAARGEPLRALLAILEKEFETVEGDISALYENWFIETCDEWVVPYIGGLLGVRRLHPVSPGTFSERGYVAHTLAYRRRKGTAAMLEQLARDVTGWPARVAEFFELLATTQYLNHVRLDNVITPDVRDTASLELVGGPFERVSHTAEVRHIDNARGRYNIANLGLFLWRLQSYAITSGDARPAVEPPDGRYRFNPLGLDAPLFNQPQTETEITRLAEEANVPGMLRRRPLYDELEARRQALADARTPSSLYFGPNPVIQVSVAGAGVPPEQVVVCDLSDLANPPGEWRRPPTSKSYTPSSGGAAVNLPLQVSVDPVLGRLAFPAGIIPPDVQVSYAYGFSGDLGGGPYNRQDSVSTWLDPEHRPVTWQRGVTRDPQTLGSAPDPSQLLSSIQAAIGEWNTFISDPANAGAFGLIAILDSRTYQESLTGQFGIQIPAGAKLAVVAADWPVVEVSGLKQRIVGQVVPNRLRPHVLGDMAIAGTAASSDPNPGEFVLDGVLLEGGLTILAGNLGNLLVIHSTLAPANSGLQAASGTGAGEQNENLSVNLNRTISGPLVLGNGIPALNITDSIVTSGSASADDSPAVTAPAAATNIQSSTVFGASVMRTLEASNSIFSGIVTVERRQVGCVRFCYVPAGSQTPRRYRCQPELALKGVDDPAAQAALRARLAPQFTSVQYGQPAYAQLSLACAPELRTGADDGSEMGAFSFLKQPQREANLRASLEEYLRFGLEAGIFFVS